MIQIIAPPGFLPEKTYAFRVLLEEILGLNFTITFSDTTTSYQLVLPNAHVLILADCFFGRKEEGEGYTLSDVPAEPGYIQYRISQRSIPVLYGKPRLYYYEYSITCEADLVAATFFMTTRWEEAVKPERDQYGRFPAHAAYAAQYNLLDTPVVHEWAELIWQCLLDLGYPESARSQRAYTVQLSCDVDHPFLWWQPWERLRTLAGAVQRPYPIQEWSYWLQRNRLSGKDPFDTFDELIRLACNSSTVQFNFLGKRPPHFDCWYDLSHPRIGDLLRHLEEQGQTIGFHPSREAALDRAQFDTELEGLRQVTTATVTTGRHHYLCFSAPDTWQMWEDAGMTMDTTAGYPELPGFRTGMCIDYPVFNFRTRRPLKLREQPLIAMDVTFLEYLKKDVAGTMNKLQYLRHQTQLHQGQFTLLWHNSSIHTPIWQPYWDALTKTMVC